MGEKAARSIWGPVVHPFLMASCVAHLDAIADERKDNKSTAQTLGGQACIPTNEDSYTLSSVQMATIITYAFFAFKHGQPCASSPATGKT